MRRRRISEREREKIFERAHGRCHWCGHKIDAGRERWDLEHVIPLGLGGTEDPMDDNLQPIHRRCHIEKTKADVADVAKAKRQARRQKGIKRQPKSPFRGWQRFNGDPVWRNR